MTDDAYNAEKVRARIKEILERRDIAARRAAEDAGVSEGALRRFLTGDTDSMQLSNIVRIADVLDLTVSELIADPRLPADAPPAPRASDQARRTLMTIRQWFMDKSAEIDAALA